MRSNKTSLVLILFVIIASEYVYVNRAQQTQSLVRIQNTCPYPVWPVWISYSKDPEISGASSRSLDSGGSFYLYAPWGWYGRIWGRTGCNWTTNGQTSKFTCKTGDCGDYSCGSRRGTSATVAEFVPLGDPKTDRDYYDVSIVDGFNFPVQISPSNSNTSCPNALCASKDGYCCKSAKCKNVSSCPSGPDYTVKFCA